MFCVCRIKLPGMTRHIEPASASPCQREIQMNTVPSVRPHEWLIQKAVIKTLIQNFYKEFAQNIS